MRRTAIALPVSLLLFALALISREAPRDSRLEGGLRLPERNGWVFVHLQGSPAQIGFQHGYLLAPEIREAQRVVSLGMEHDTKRGWKFFRDAARDVFWPHVEPEYRQELEGIAAGLNARGVKLDVWDITAMNAWQELSPNYIQWLEERQKTAPLAKVTAPEHCSAFVATGSYTTDGRVVIGHNAWTGYMEGDRFRLYSG